MDVKGDIDQFFGQVENLKRQIDGLSQEHFCRILLFSLLDALSKCAFPEEKRFGANKRRFVQLIDRYSDWKHKDRVSLPQLKKLILLQYTAE